MWEQFSGDELTARYLGSQKLVDQLFILSVDEAYRTRKHELVEYMAQMPDKQLLLAVIWQDGKLHDSAEIDAKMQKNLQRLVERLSN